MIEQKIQYKFKNKKVNDIFYMFDEYLDAVKKVDLVKTNSYFNEINNIVDNDNIYIEKAVFLNYKKLSYLELELNSKLNVIIGQNGVGKTSILNGIVKNISWLVNNILKDNNNGMYITEDEISNFIENKEIQTSMVECFFRYGNHTNIDGELIKHKAGFTSKKQSKLTKYKNIGTIWRTLNSSTSINLPFFAFYSVKRFNDKVNNKIEIKKDIDKFEAYRGILDGTVKFDSFVKWLLQCLKIQSSSNDLNGYKSRLELIRSAKAVLVVGTDIYNVLDEEEKTLNSFLNKIDNNSVYIKQLDLINSLVREVFKDFIGFKLELSSGFDEIFLVYENKKEVNLTQLSDGERVFIGLLMDIAYRLILLNSNRKNPFEGMGIVIIDEIELHLHPKWQQNAILILQKSFPNLQFIISTHSPHILSTVDMNSIKIIYSDLVVRQPDYQTKGIMSSDVLELIMDTKSIPDIKEAHDLKYLNSLIQSDQYNSDEFRELLSQSISHFGENHPEIVNINSIMKFKQLKNELKNRFRSNEQ